MLEGLLGRHLLRRRPAARNRPGPPASCRGTRTTRRCAGARLARKFWNDPAYADRLEREAAELQGAVQPGLLDRRPEYYALALDADGRQVDALASNMGHLLWSGIVDESRAAQVAAHLLGPRLFSGWGVRTLAEDQARYNPIGYHVGTVWPFDNSIIAWGLRRYGFARGGRPDRRGRSRRVALLRRPAAGGVRRLRPGADRLPGAATRRRAARRPGPPGAPLLLLRALLGLEPVGRAPDHRPARCRPGSAGSSCWTFPGGGAGST